MILAWVGLSVCAIWLYYFGVYMNYVETDCYWLTGYKNKSPNVPINTVSMKSGLGFGYNTVTSYDVTYRFRIICVVGVSCFSLLGFISCAQVLKPLYILLCFVLPYTAVAFVWWFIYSYKIINSFEA